MHILNDNKELYPTLSEKEMDVLYLARYFYKYGFNGKEFLSDRKYQILLDKLESVNPDHILLNRLWSNDPIPYEILKKYNLPIAKVVNKSEYLPREILDLKEKYKHQISIYAEDLLNRSIKLYRTFDDISRWFMVMPAAKYHASVKADGINYSATYIKGNLVDVTTRSRDGDGIDITYQGRLLLPTKIDTEEEIIKISGEIVLPFECLPYFREKYNKPYKTARNSVNSVLLTCEDAEDIRKLIALTFKVKSELLNTLEDEFRWLENNGFITTPNATFTYNGNTESFKEVFSKFEPFRRNLAYGSDGLVVAVNDSNHFYELGGTSTHFNGNIACKVGVWDATSYTTTVLGLDWTYNTTKITPVLIVDPVETETGQTVSRINAHHLQRLLDLGITLGSEVSFNYVSDCYVELVY